MGDAPPSGAKLVKGALAIKAKHACRLVLPDVLSICSSFGEEIVYTVCARTVGKRIVADGHGQSPRQCCGCPRSAHCTAGAGSTHDRSFSDLSTTNDVGNMTQGRGVPDRHVLHTCAAFRGILPSGRRTGWLGTVVSGCVGFLV